VGRRGRGLVKGDDGEGERVHGEVGGGGGGGKRGGVARRERERGFWGSEVWEEVGGSDADIGWLPRIDGNTLCLFPSFSFLPLRLPLPKNLPLISSPPHFRLIFFYRLNLTHPASSLWNVNYDNCCSIRAGEARSEEGI